MLAASLVLVTTYIGACGREPTSSAANPPDYPQRIANLRREEVLRLRLDGSGRIDSGSTTACIDPGFDNRTPAVFVEYSHAQQIDRSFAELKARIAGYGWEFLGETQTGAGSALVANFSKEFNSWQSRLLLTVRRNSYQIVLQASQSSVCDEDS